LVELTAHQRGEEEVLYEKEEFDLKLNDQTERETERQRDRERQRVNKVLTETAGRRSEHVLALVTLIFQCRQPGGAMPRSLASRWQSFSVVLLAVSIAGNYMTC
jgi:hypothetical protein